MLNRIIQFSLHHRLLVLVAAVLLCVWGLHVGEKTEVDVFPDLNAPTVVVMTEAGGMAAEEVERLVTFPLETALNGATDVRRVRSSSSMGFSVLWVEFDWGTDVYRDRQIVSEKLATVMDRLPEGVGQPTLGPQSSILGELLIVSLTADSTSMLDLRTLADNVIRPRLLSTGGVAQVAVLGGDIKEYQILLNPDRMRYYGVTLAEVMAATREMNRNVAGGVTYEYGNEYIVRGVVSTTDVSQMAEALVKSVGGHPVKLADIATVQVGGQEPKLGVASERGKPAVLLTVTKQIGAGTMEVTTKLEDALQDLQKNMPGDISVKTDVFRQSRFIESSINNVKTSLLEGAFFVVIVLFLFLANVRTTLISLVTIPLALLVTLLVLHYMDFSINTMSLGGMAIAIGSLVDDAIVDVENVLRRIRENRMLPADRQLSTLRVVYEASSEVRMPILNSTLIIVVSFTPLFFLSGMEGRMLVPLGVAFIVSLFASTLVALTLTPVLCTYLLHKTATSDSLPREAFLAVWLKRVYHTTLLWVLAHRRTVLGATACLLVAALVVFARLGHSFLPPFNEGSFTINVSSLPGISLEESDRIGRRAEEILLTIPEVKTVARKTGRAELDEHALGVNVSEIEVPFELGERSHQELLADVREKLSVLVGANIEIGQPISHRIDAMLSGTRASIAIKLFGNDLNRMYQLAQQVRTAAAGVEGVADLNVEQLVERPELKIIPKRALLAQAGITMAEFNDFVAVHMAGQTVSQVYEEGNSFNLVVRAESEYRSSMERIRDLMLDMPDGGKIPLVDVADVVSTTGPNTINRENVKRKIVISANASGRDLRSVVNDIRQAVQENVPLPEGYHIEYGGQFESEQAASRTLLLTSIFSIIVIFLLLYVQFERVKTSAVILLNLPLALIGGVLAIWFTGGELSIPAIIGFISLFGIATRNGMLLITQYDHLRTTGLSLRQSILRGSQDRLNPILMTALTSALALVPLAIQGDLSGNEIQSPMARVILGGLLTSTFLNAFIIPIVYEWMNTGKNQEQKNHIQA